MKLGIFSLLGGKGKKGYTLHLRGNRLVDAQKFDEAKVLHAQAIDLYQQAIDAGEKVPKHMMAYGVLLMRAKEFEKAHDLMLQTERMPGITRDEKRQLRINFAICEWKLGRLDNAIKQMQMAAADYKNSMIYGSLGYMLIEKAIQTGDFAEALAFNQEALDYDDDDAVVLDNMGQLKLAMGDREAAMEYFRKAHERRPGQVDTLYYLAKMSAEDGRPEKAKEYLERAFKGNYSALCTTSREQAQALYDTLG